MAENNQVKIVRLETQMSEVNEKVRGVDEKVTTLSAKTDERFNSLDKKIDDKFDTLIENLDKRYAPSLAGYLIYGFVGLVLVAVMGALLALVVFPNQFGSSPQPPSSSSSSSTTGGNGTPSSPGSTTTTNNSTTTTTPDSTKSQGGASVTVPLPIK